MTETTIKKHIPFGEPISPDTAQGGFGFIPNGIREKNIFFYHPDHLGSSSYITGQDGKVSQHTEYIAFGEILFDEHNTEHTMPYLFNGKELDQETNLTYFGARYLDMKTSLWLNTDPLSGYNPIQETEHYIDGQHNSGIFNPMNLNTYGYTYQNPILYIDPNGKQVYFNSKVDKSNKRYFEFSNQGNNSKLSHLTIINVFDKNNKYVKEIITGTDAAGITELKYGNHYRAAPNNPKSGWDYTKQVAKIAWDSEEVRPILLSPISAFTESVLAEEVIISNMPRIKDIKELKSLINILSKNDRRLGFKNLKKLENTVEKYGGKVRYDMLPIKGKRGPHVQIEGFGTSVKSKHIQLSKEAINKINN